MTNEQFRAWKAYMQMTNPSIAEALGLSLRSIAGYVADVTIPHTVELACCELWRRRNETPKEAEARSVAFDAVLNAKG